MNKNIFREFLTSEIENKKTLLVSNSISDEDKTAIQLQIDGLNTIVEKIDALEDEGAVNELVEELKQTVNEMGERLTALNEKINLKNKETKDETEMNKNYLETKNAVRDFAAAIRNSKTADEMKANWGEYLSTNGITIESGSEEGYLPTAVKGLTSDAWVKYAGWLKDLNYTGAKRFYVRHNISNQDAETSRAKGWKKGGTKAAQEIELSAKLLEGQFIYKIAEIDYKTKFDNDEDLIAYVIGETTSQILYEIKRAILVGDGRQANDPYKIDSFEAIAKDTADAYTNVSTVTANGFLIDDMRIMVDSINNPDEKPIYVFMSKDDLRVLSRVQSSATATPVYMSTEDVCGQLGCDRIITTDLLGSDFRAVAMIPNEYYMVGAPNLLTPILYTWHEGYKNLDVYRNETVAGGGVNGLKSTAVLLAE